MLRMIGALQAQQHGLKIKCHPRGGENTAAPSTENGWAFSELRQN
jgi:hypothetical protein